MTHLPTANFRPGGFGARPLPLHPDPDYVSATVVRMIYIFVHARNSYNRTDRTNLEHTSNGWRMREYRICGEWWKWGGLMEWILPRYNRERTLRTIISKAEACVACGRCNRRVMCMVFGFGVNDIVEIAPMLVCVMMTSVYVAWLLSGHCDRQCYMYPSCAIESTCVDNW